MSYQRSVGNGMQGTAFPGCRFVLVHCCFFWFVQKGAENEQHQPGFYFSNAFSVTLFAYKSQCRLPTDF